MDENIELNLDKPKIPVRFGGVVSCVIVFIAFAIMTTNVQLASVFDFANLGLSFFIILFLSNLIYLINFSSSAKNSKLSDVFLEAKKRYDDTKTKLTELDWMRVLDEFCRSYVAKDLERARINILMRAGIKYEDFIEKYIGKSMAELKNAKLSKEQLKVIKKAKAVKPIVLTSDMIFTFGGKVGTHRGPLGLSPGKKSAIKRSRKVVTSIFTSLITATIALEFVMQPSWQMFCFCLVKTIPILYNWFAGNRDGTDSVEIDLVGYIGTQSDLMSQAIQFNSQSGQKVDTKIA